MNHRAPFPFAIVGFDLDGTLLDTHRDLAAALDHALALAGRAAVSDPAARGLIGGGTSSMLARALLLTGDAVAPDEFDRLRDALLAFYADHIAVHTRLFPGGEAMLDTLARMGVKLAVVTNKLEALAIRLIDAVGLGARFYTVIGGDTLGPDRAKPAPDLLIEMIARAELPDGARSAYIGDTTYDVQAARAAGMPCVAVSFGFNDLPVDQLGAGAVIDHFAALVPALARL